MKPEITEVEINLDHLLWRTRSKNQDYQFIKEPKSPNTEKWYSFVHRDVFPYFEPTRDLITRKYDLKNVVGTLVLKENFPFVATAFVDERYLDSSKRPILHFLAWFPPKEYDILEIKEFLPNDWGCCLTSPAGVYPPYYESGDTSQLKERDHVIRISRDALKKSHFVDIGKINLELPPKPSRCSQARNKVNSYGGKLGKIKIW